MTYVEGMAATRGAARSLVALVPFVLALAGLIFVSSAGAAAQRNLKEEFGPAAKPSFEAPAAGITIDRATGDVLIPSGNGTQAGTIRRFHADGTPAPFQALGTNVIDGASANGKPCAQEPASCDQTPENQIQTGSGQVPNFQIAIDESGGVADGDIYLSQSGSALVDIFAGDGRYLGQLTGFEATEYRDDVPEGIAVDSDGAVFVADDSKQINVFEPAQNPATNADFVANLPYPKNEDQLYRDDGNAERLAFGSGPTAGTLFAAYYRPRCIFSPEGECYGQQPTESIVQLDPQTGKVLSRFDVGGASTGFSIVMGSVAVNPTNGNVLDGSGNEFEVRAGSQPVQVSHFDPAKSLGQGLAVNGANEVIAPEFGENGYAVSIYDPPAVVPTLTVEPAKEITGTRATFAGTVNPAGLPLTGEKCIFQYGPAEPLPAGPETRPEDIRVNYEHTVPCEGPIPAGSTAEPVSARAEKGLAPGQTYGFRLVAFNQNGREVTLPLEFTTAKTVVTEPASGIGLTTATLNGSVLPEGSAYSECFFQYGLSTSVAFEDTVPCDPAAADIKADFVRHKVDAAIEGLQSNTTYRYRLVATNGALGQVSGQIEVFTTLGTPRIVEVGAGGADQSSLTLEARINPSGFGTSYRFEWGPTPAYGNLAPLEFEPFIGAGTEPILVKARIDGLAAGTVYHYRVVAESGRGHVESADQIAETLNACGLPEGRCFEEVSRHEAGPVALVGESNAQIELHFQAATTPGGFAYPVESGYPESTKGAEVLYRGLRSPGGWESAQISAGINTQNEREDQASQNSEVHWLSDDLSCGFEESTSQLTTDPGTKLIRELGGGNLYRINPDNSFTAVTTLPPQNVTQGSVPGGRPGLTNYGVAWGSQDCDVTVFTSAFTYSGISSTGTEHLYEWRDGTLRDAALVPGPDGKEVSVGATPGAGLAGGGDDTQNSVSADGSRIFLTATRQIGPDPAEVGKQAVFVREDGRETRDVSQSETAVPDLGATYQWATADGSKVFFIANTGLAEGTTGSGAPCNLPSGEGCELYEYDLQSGDLIDRSPTAIDGGAQVIGFVGASADGSRVYFASPNELVPGSGSTRDENLADQTFSIYSERGGQISFAGRFAKSDLTKALIQYQTYQVAQVSPDGRYLVFETNARNTGYKNESVQEVYLYDADAKGVTCVSCRQDGRPSEGGRYGSPGYPLLRRGNPLNNRLHAPQFLTERGGEAKVFFSSPDPLAPGAVPGQNNIYEWSHHQIFRLASAPAGSQLTPYAGRIAIFGGASDDATDVYLITPENLTWEDGDERQSAYDARIGGGFPEPPPSGKPCQADAERSCAAPPPVVQPSAPATTQDRGSQNAEAKKQKNKKKHHKKRRHKKHHKKRNHRDKARGADGNRRNGK